MTSLLYVEVWLHYTCIYTSCCLIYLPRSSHPSGRRSVLPELTVLLLLWISGRLTAGFKAPGLTEAVNGPRTRLLTLVATPWQLKSEETTELESI